MHIVYGHMEDKLPCHFPSSFVYMIKSQFLVKLLMFTL